MIYGLRLTFFTLVLLATPMLSSCSSAYYSTMERFGIHKRDILVDRVEKGRQEQEAAKEQFQTTLEAFQELTAFDGGDLQEIYEKLNREYRRAQERADEVSERVDSIQKVSDDLFSEWQEELAEMANAELKGKSEEMMRDTLKRYEHLIGKMRSAETKMEPVLAEFRDHVTFLKHNLNAQAISSLRDTSISIEGEVSSLVKEMQASIEEADAFISAMST